MAFFKSPFLAEALTAWLVSAAAGFYACWTLAYHVATFGHIPWQDLSQVMAFASLPLALGLGWAGARFATSYCHKVAHAARPRGILSPLALALVILTLVLMALAKTYQLRFGMAAIGFIAVAWFSRHPDNAGDDRPVYEWRHPKTALVILLGLMAVAVAIALTAHRSDFDDAEYLQMGMQTLRFPELAPLTFDMSLGHKLEQFRFAAYRVSSYEMLVAWLTQWTGVKQVYIYYILMPAINAALMMGAGYLFLRWFLPSGMALVATAIFLCIVLAWGEAHVAFGNRLLVRLFQGKGLLIALTTPMTIVTGMMVLRRASLLGWAMLAAMQIVAVGVSSSGIITSVICTGLVLVQTLQKDWKTMLRQGMTVAATLFYPLGMGVWLMLNTGKGAALNDIGTYLPINASFGLAPREVLALGALIAGAAALRRKPQSREYLLLAGTTLLVIFSPWFSELVAAFTARNMTWRLAWAAPMPLLVALGLTSCLTIGTRHKPAMLGTALALSMFALFLGMGQWTLARSNGVAFAAPYATLPFEESIAREFSATGHDKEGVVLAGSRIGTWLTVTSPGIRLVLPGHGYPPTLQTILPPEEFARRNGLLTAVDGGAFDPATLVPWLQTLDVKVLVVPDNEKTKSFIGFLQKQRPLSLTEAAPITGHRIFILRYKN